LAFFINCDLATLSEEGEVEVEEEANYANLKQLVNLH